MMITDWTSADGRRVFGKLTIEWVDGPNRYRLHYRPEMGGWGCDRLIGGQWVYCGDIALDIALAKIQKDAREWLAGRLIDIRFTVPGNSGRLVWFAWNITEDRGVSGIQVGFDDPDQCLIAAILAAGETQ